MKQYRNAERTKKMDPQSLYRADIQYLKGDLVSSIDMVGDVIVEAVEKLKRNY